MNHHAFWPRRHVDIRSSLVATPNNQRVGIGINRRELERTAFIRFFPGRVDMGAGFAPLVLIMATRTSLATLIRLFCRLATSHQSIFRAAKATSRENVHGFATLLCFHVHGPILLLIMTFSTAIVRREVEYSCILNSQALQLAEFSWQDS